MAARAGRLGGFVGRPQAAGALRRRFDAVRSGEGGVTLLVGEAGVGKTTLVSELVEESREHGVRVLVGRSPGDDDPAPFALLRSAMESASEDPQLRSDADPQLGSDQILVGFVPGIGEEALPAPVGIEDRLIEALGGGSLAGRTTREQFLKELGERFLEYTRHGPTLLVLEDVDRADAPSLAAVEFFRKELEGRPLGLVATSRPPDTLAASGRARLERFARETRAVRIDLPSLSSSETAEYLRGLEPAREIATEEVARRHAETGGNPYLLSRAAVAPPDGFGDRDAPAGEVPLDDEMQAVLELAAVLGSRAPFAVLQRASDLDEERLAEVVDRLVGRGLLFERPGEVIEFPEQRLWEQRYAALPERRRRPLHRRAGAALEDLGGTDRSLVFALARHFYLGREPAKSVRYNRLAAEIAERGLAPEVAWDHLSHALESQRQVSPADPDEEAAIALGFARVTEELGLLQDAEGILREFLSREDGGPRASPGRRAMLEIFLARILTDRGDLPSAQALATAILENPRLADQPLVRLGAHHQLGQVLYWNGKYPEAVAHHTEEVTLAERMDNPRLLLRAKAWRVASLAMMGETARAISEARELTVERDRLGSVRESAQAHLFLGDILADARSPAADRQSAVTEYAAAIRFAEQSKSPRQMGWALYKTAELLREAGQLDASFEKAGQAIHILRQVGDHIGLSMAVKVRGQVAMDRGDLDAAEAELGEASGLLEGTGHTTEQIDVELQLVRLSLKRGNREEAARRSLRLDRLDVARVRPDLLPELAELRRALAQG